MPAFKDLTGQRFTRLLVIERGETRKWPGGSTTYWKVRCDCGTEKEIGAGSLTGGTTKSCGCLNRQMLADNRLDLAGTNCGFLTYVGEVEFRNGMRRIECFCACGKKHIMLAQAYIQQTVKSCGCYNAVLAAQLGRRALKDMTGQKFGRLTVIQRDDAPGSKKWKCRCDCGVEKKVEGQHLRRGAIKSCGCLHRELTRERHAQTRDLKRKLS